MLKNSTPDLAIRFLALVLLLARMSYWKITELQANRNKPKREAASWAGRGKRLASLLVSWLLLAQILGLPVLTFDRPLMVEAAGLILAALGFWMSMSARHTLGTNWAHAAEYQIKERHELVTAGIYHYVRHPIYGGLMLLAFGVELIVGSYIGIIFVLVMPFIGLSQAKKEESILVREFGSDYRDYMRHSRRFVPYLW